ncbi:hypothetical protein [Paenibacillus vini]|uniref:Uncharacterized protein n=1 Tax=Paenibacillus vini TaxID=1476024 RepID=A0ABQ4MGU6_9BACL|nr:hypothetical protein [Paenibacillus vini]GIP55206.1 hypothetical protein J42TS3_42410 [Paenibacillus vini]
MTIRALEEFKAAEKEFDDRLTAVKNELWSMEKEQSKLTQEYRQMNEEDTAGTKHYSMSEFNKIKNRLAELKDEIEFARERVGRIEESKGKQLKPLIEAVRQGVHAREGELKEFLDSTFDELRSHRAQMLLLLQKAHQEAYAELYQLYEEVFRAESVCDYDRARRRRISWGVDVHSVLNDAEGKIGILTEVGEIMKAANVGEVPSWVHQYAGERDGVPGA